MLRAGNVIKRGFFYYNSYLCTVALKMRQLFIQSGTCLDVTPMMHTFFYRQPLHAVLRTLNDARLRPSGFGGRSPEAKGKA